VKGEEKDPYTGKKGGAVLQPRKKVKEKWIMARQGGKGEKKVPNLPTNEKKRAEHPPG